MNQSLLLEIQKFAMGKNLYHREDPAEGNLFNSLKKYFVFLNLCVYSNSACENCTKAIGGTSSSSGLHI